MTADDNALGLHSAVLVWPDVVEIAEVIEGAG